MTGVHQVLASGAANIIELSHVDSGANSGSTTAYTFAGESFGAAHVARRMYVCVSNAALSLALPTSVTLGGIAATMIHSATTTFEASSIWQALVPTGATGDVVINFASSPYCCGHSLYRAVNGPATTHDTASDTVSTVTQSMSIDVVAGGALIAFTSVDAAGPFSWTGVTEDLELIVESGAVNMSTGSLSVTSTETNRSVTMVDGTAVVAACIAVSFAPP